MGCHDTEAADEAGTVYTSLVCKNVSMSLVLAREEVGPWRTLL